MQLYNEHLAQYLADDRFRYTQYEAQSLGLAKARRAKRKSKFSLRRIFAQLAGVFVKRAAQADGR